MCKLVVCTRKVLLSSVRFIWLGHFKMYVGKETRHKLIRSTDTELKSRLNIVLDSQIKLMSGRNSSVINGEIAANRRKFPSQGN